MFGDLLHRRAPHGPRALLDSRLSHSTPSSALRRDIALPRPHGTRDDISRWRSCSATARSMVVAVRRDARCWPSRIVAVACRVRRLGTLWRLEWEYYLAEWCSTSQLSCPAIGQLHMIDRVLEELDLAAAPTAAELMLVEDADFHISQSRLLCVNGDTEGSLPSVDMGRQSSPTDSPSSARRRQ